MFDQLRSISLLLVLLNPFLVIIYLVDVIEKLDKERFYKVLIRAGGISSVTFCLFSILGDVIFKSVVHAEFASFQIFGGIIFLIIALQFVFKGPRAIEILRGESEHIAGAIAMPIFIGPGTISVSVIIGKRHESLVACGVIIVSVSISILTMLILKYLHDYVRKHNEALIERYIEIAGRITALIVGTISVEMIFNGIKVWAGKF